MSRRSLIARLPRRAARCGGLAGGVGVSLESAARLPMPIALDGQSDPAAHGGEFGEPNAAKLGEAHAEIAEAEGDVGVVGIEFR